MSVTSGFFNSLNGDRRYSAEQFSALIDTLIIDGVFSNVGTAFGVVAQGGTSIGVGIGRAWFNSTWIYNDTVLPMTVRDAELVLDRIDAVVIEINRSETVRAGSIRFVNGVPSGDPQRPELTNSEEVHQYPLAYIYRKAGVNNVVQADITNMIGTSACPYVIGILDTQNIDKLIAQWDSEFNIWFKGLENILDGDIAGSLALRILELEDKFRDLAKDRCVTDDLKDSNDDDILDSYGQKILGSTMFPMPQTNSNDTSITDIKPCTLDDVYAIGDILRTSRLSVGDNWLLCNGAAISASQFPTLAEMLKSPPNRSFGTFGTLWQDATIANPSASALSLSFVDNYLIACGIVNYDGYSGDYRPIFAYCNYPSSSWTIKSDLPYSGDYVTLYKIVKHGSYYVGVCSRETSSGIEEMYIMYATSITSSSWSTKTLRSAPDKYYDKLGDCCILEHDGTLMTFVSNYRNTSGTYYDTQLYWTTGSPGSGWNNVDLSGKIVNGFEPRGFKYFEDGNYVIFGGNSVNSNSGMLYTKDITQNSSWASKYFSYGDLYDLIYVNGYYIGLFGTNVYRSKTLTSSSWTLIGSFGTNLRKIVVVNNYLVVFPQRGSCRYTNAKNIETITTNSWATGSSAFSSTNQTLADVTIANDDSILVSGLDGWVSGSTSQSAKVFRQNISSSYLPTISSDGLTRWFIKAKEAQ